MRLATERASHVDAVADPKRRKAATAMRRAIDTVVYVEGGADQAFFRRYTSVPTLTFTNIGRKRGKKEILETVSIAEDTYGIVDMDHDFDSTMVADSRLVDTSQQCCLYSYVIRDGGSAEMTDLAMAAVHSVCRDLQDDQRIYLIRDDMVDRLRYGGDRFRNFVLERSKAVLYRGHLGDRREKVPPREGECKWSDVESNNGNPVSDLITDAMSQGYELFKQEYSEQISAAGVNDHAICDAITLLFKDQYQGYHEREQLVRSRVVYHVGRLMIGKGNSDMANYFLSELGLIDD